MTDLLEIRNLSIAFGDTYAVKGIDLSVGARETLALVGESGSGKSATAMSILRLNSRYADTDGKILFDGQDILALRDSDVRRLRGKHIAMIFQEPMACLNPVLTIGEQVVETLQRHRGLSHASATAEAVRLLDLVRLPLPAHLTARYPHNLSGGQRQRVMIAIAVACQPKLLIADEPTTALDVTTQAEILALIDGLKRELDMSVLLITHDLGVVARWADRVSVMFDGRIMETGPVTQILERPTHSYTRGLLAASLHLNDKGHYTRGRLTEIRKSVGESGGQVRFDLHTPPLARPVATSSLPDGDGAHLAARLSVRELEVSYKDRGGRTVQAVDRVSFDIAAGETLGLVGESGCGKSSVAKAIMCLVPASAGEVRVEGTNILSLSGRALYAHRRALQLVFQDPYGSLNPRQSVFDMLDFVQRLRGVTDRHVRRREAVTLLDQVGLPATALNRFPHEFSGGQRQRLVIARAVIQKPKLIICDEPVSALDVSVQAQILNLLSDLKHHYQLSYLFISHDLNVVRYFTDRVLVMKDGRIVDQGRHDTLWEKPGSSYTHALIASVPHAGRANP